MAVPIADLVVRFRGDTKHYNAAKRDVERGNDRLRRGFSAVQKAAAAAFAVAGAGYAAKRIFDLGAAVEETASKYRTVFGPAVAETNAYITDQARLLGLTDQQAQDLIATTGAIAQGMGFAQGAAADFAIDITALAGDLASFNNVPIERTANAIQSALTGEREALKSLGIVVREAEVQQRALAATGKESVDALTQQERATATLQLITERAGVAVGDLARTQDSAANRARKVGARIRELRDDIAKALLPVLGQVLDWLDQSTGGFDTLGDRIKANSDVLVAWAGVGVEAIKTFATALATPIRVAFNLGQAIANAFSILVSEIKGDHDSADAALNLLRFNMRQGMEAAGALGSAFEQLTAKADAAWAALAGRGTGGGGGGGGGATNAADTVRTVVEEQTEATAQMAESVDMATNSIRTMRREARPLVDVGQSIATSFSDTLVNALTSAGDAFKSFVDYAISQLLRLAAQFAVFSGLKALFPGAGIVSSIGQMFGFTGRSTVSGVGLGGIQGIGAFARGGYLEPGRVGLVGEQGPELVRAGRQGATITPNGGTGGVIRLEAPSGQRNMEDFVRDPYNLELMTEWLREVASVTGMRLEVA